MNYYDLGPTSDISERIITRMSKSQQINDHTFDFQSPLIYCNLFLLNPEHISYYNDH